MVVYFSFDFESAGPNYATNGVNGLGIVVFSEKGEELECYETGIMLTNGRQMDPTTKREFWDKQPEALQWLKEHEEPPWIVVWKIAKLYQKYTVLSHKVEWVAWPAAFDWGLMIQFYNEFKLPEAPYIGYSAICLSSMVKAWQFLTGGPKKLTLEDLGCPIENPHFPGSAARAQGKAFFVVRDQFASRELNLRHIL